jgi:CHASE3 domain sensor protein
VGSLGSGRGRLATTRLRLKVARRTRSVRRAVTVCFSLSAIRDDQTQHFAKAIRVLLAEVRNDTAEM